MRISFLLASLLMAYPDVSMATDYTLLATPTTVEWGHYAANAKPALMVHSGDTVKIQTLSTCGPNSRIMS